jgi:hypothetical protein
MMSQSLYRMGRLSARRPWVVIATCLTAQVVVTPRDDAATFFDSAPGGKA